MDEEWRPIMGFWGYEASSLGRVRRSVKARCTSVGKVMALTPDRRGYLTVSLTIDGKQKRAFAHRLVAIAFHGLPSPDTQQAAHLNGARDDNRPENLAWKSAKENAADKLLHGTHNRGERHPMAKLTEAQARAVIARIGGSPRQIARELCLPSPAVEAIVQGRRWKHIQGEVQ